MNTAELARAAERGRDVLDAKVPGWRGKIDPSTLDMGRDRACIIAQVAGDEYGAYGSLIGNLSGLGAAWSEAHYEWAAEHGFDAPRGEAWISGLKPVDRSCYPVLQTIWLAILEQEPADA